jgi:hypothetical protein
MQSEYNIGLTNYHELHPVEDNRKTYGGCNLIYKNGEQYKLTASGIGLDAFVKHFAAEHVKTEVDSPIFSYEPYGYDSRFNFQSLFASSAKKGDEIHSIIINRNTGEDIETTVNLIDYSDRVKYDMYLLHAPLLSSEKEEIKLEKIEEDKTVKNGFIINVPKYNAVILEIKKEVCIPDCANKTCGDDNSCGGKCTNCPEGKYCDTGSWQCISGGQGECAAADIWGVGGEADGKISGYDLSLMLANWKCRGGTNCVKADIWGKGGNRDGKVNGYDLSKMLSCWKRI